MAKIVMYFSGEWSAANVDNQPDKARFRKWCVGCGEALIKSFKDALDYSQDDY